MQVLIDGAEAASRVVKLGVNAFSDEAVLERIALLGEGGVTDSNLLVVQQDVSDSDRSSVKLAQWSDAIVLHIRLEFSVEVVLEVSRIILGLFLIVLLRNCDLEREFFVLLVAHDLLVVDWDLDLGAVGLFGSAELGAASCASCVRLLLDLLQHFGFDDFRRLLNLGGLRLRLTIVTIFVFLSVFILRVLFRLADTLLGDGMLVRGFFRLVCLVDDSLFLVMRPAELFVFSLNNSFLHWAGLRFVDRLIFMFCFLLLALHTLGSFNVMLVLGLLNIFGGVFAFVFRLFGVIDMERHTRTEGSEDPVDVIIHEETHFIHLRCVGEELRTHEALGSDMDVLNERFFNKRTVSVQLHELRMELTLGGHEGCEVGLFHYYNL